MNKSFASLAAGVTIALAAAPAFAANEAAAIAAKYAQDAAAATTIEAVHSNMRMALNCLVGPGDEAYVAAAGGTCADGAITTADGMAAISYRLAAQIAKTAIALDTLGGAQFAARTAERLITTTAPNDVDDRNGQGLLQDRGDQACEQTGEQAGNQNAIRHGRSRTALDALPECRYRHN